MPATKTPENRMPENRTPASAAVPEKLKQRLYPVVLDLFSENDFHRVSIREISRRSGVSSGTLYKYWASKEALIFSILDEKIKGISLSIESQIRGMADIREILRKVLWVTFDFYDQNPGVAVTAFITVPTRTWMQETGYRRTDDLSGLKKAVEKAQAENQIDPDLSFRQISDAYYMICYRHIHNWYYAGMDNSLVNGLEAVFRLFWKMVMPLPA